MPPERDGTRLEWVMPIIEIADNHNIPVFLKNNLKALSAVAAETGVSVEVKIPSTPREAIISASQGASKENGRTGFILFVVISSIVNQVFIGGMLLCGKTLRRDY